MDDICVGIVFHGRQGGQALRSPASRPRPANAGPRHGTPWRGFAANHNDLMSRSQARWYVALNPDVEIDASAIRALVHVAEEAGLALSRDPRSPPGSNSHGKRGFPGPQLDRGDHSRSWPPRAQRESRRRGGGGFGTGLSGACLAIRRDLGLFFDERYFMYFEDADLCRRARQRGLRVGVCPSVRACHTSGWSSGDPLVQRRGVEFARSAIAFAQGAGISARAMTLAGIVRFGSRIVLPGEDSSRRAAASSIARGFANPSLPGLSELAAQFNAAGHSVSRAGTLDAVV